MRILQCVGDINPALGGSVEAARQLSVALNSLGHSVDLVTLSALRDGWQDEWRGAVHCLGPASTSYLYSSRLPRWMAAHASSYDAVVIHGLWRYTSVGAWQGLRGRNVPFFIFPHGMLDPYFNRAYRWKHLKKYICWLTAEHRVLSDAQAVLFTCDEERLRARHSFQPYHCRERVVGLGICRPFGDPALERARFLDQFPALAGKRIVLFLGRVHPKKGCDLLMRAFAHRGGCDPRLHLVMAGPDECGWQADLRQLAGRLGIEKRITWTGPLYGDLKWGALRAAEVFALPSHTENFGITIAEALACGVPVLISDQVNIWREIQAAGAGLVAPDNLEGCLRILDQWLSSPELSRVQMKVRAIECFTQHFEIEQFAKRFVECIQAA